MAARQNAVSDNPSASAAARTSARSSAVSARCNWTVSRMADRANSVGVIIARRTDPLAPRRESPRFAQHSLRNLANVPQGVRLQHQVRVQGYRGSAVSQPHGHGVHVQATLQPVAEAVASRRDPPDRGPVRKWEYLSSARPLGTDRNASTSSGWAGTTRERPPCLSSP